MPDVAAIETEEDLIRQMTAPTPAVEAAVQQLDGDVVILGVAGKMGPTLAELLVRAGARRVIGVSRFSDAAQRGYLEARGVETIRADLLDEAALKALPEAPNVFFLAGFKFGATGNEAMTWAMNTWLPGRVLQRYPDSRIVYVSSGNVYAYTPVTSSGAAEDAPVDPVGGYAQSRLGGERVAEFFCQRQGTPLTIVRLFYATELRYGIIHDIAWRIHHDEPLDLTMGHVNQIWQGDANGYLARSLPLCESPARVINLTGQEVLSVRRLAVSLGQAMGREPRFVGTEAETALLGDASALFAQYGPPPTPPERIVQWVAHWVQHDGRSLGKPTKYESRTGKF